MKTVNLADAKTHPSALVDEALAGEVVQILRRGKPVVQLTAIETPSEPFDWDALKAFTDRLPYHDEDAGTFIRRMRDEDRY